MKGLLPKSSSQYNNRRSKPTCSFCRNPNHRVGDCPHVPVIWESLQQGVIPLSYMQTIKDNDTSGQANWKQGHAYWTSPLGNYYIGGSSWGDLYSLTEKSFAKWQRKRAQECENKNKKGKRKKLTTCGYCKETGHTRTKCSHLDTHKKMLVLANRNFRQWFYEEYVEKQGLSTGCIIAFNFVTSASYNKKATSKRIQTIVTDINWDSINLLSMLDIDNQDIRWSTEVDGKKTEGLKNIRDFIRSKVLLKIPSQALSNCDFNKYTYRGYDSQDSLTSYGVELPLKPMTIQRNGRSNHNVITNFEDMERVSYGGHKTENLQVIQRAPQVLASDWVDGYSDQMSVIFKKFSQAQLEFFGVIEHIKDWANR